MNERPTPKSRHKLISIRNARGLTRHEVADSVGSHFSTIAKLERGEMKLTEEWAVKLARVYGCTPGELTGDTPLMSPIERELMVTANTLTLEGQRDLLAYARKLSREAAQKAREPSSED